MLTFAVLGGVGFGVKATFLLEKLYRLLDPITPRDPVVQPYYKEYLNPANTVAMALMGVVLGAVLARALIRLKEITSEWWDGMTTGDKVTLFLGVFLGLIASMPFLFLLNSPQLGLYNPLIVAGLTLGFSALCVYALRSMDELLPWNKLGGRGRRRGVRILDTNVLIDGRLYDLARTGFLEAQLYVPGFILEELQYIADSHDPLRRQRGRRGLDIMRHLQADYNMEIRVHDKLAPDLGDGVDARLVRLARAMGADIITNDFNLNRVAGVQNVRVLNINDLALAMRSNVLPQESLNLSVIREGNQPGQGIGYLEDGTMVVIENGREHIGETLEVTVTQVIQTERGKMIFAEIGGNGQDPSSPRKRPVSRRP